MSEQYENDDMWSLWAAKAQSGDKNAYTLLLREILPYIRNVVTPSLANLDWADDITQDVLVSVHKSLRTYDPRQPFKPWLFAIINFRKTDFLRKHYRLGKKKQDAHVAATGFQERNVTFPAFAGEWKDMEAALETLPEKQRKVFELMKIKGYTAGEVAAEMDMSVSAVKVSVHRTTHKLREALGDE